MTDQNSAFTYTSSQRGIALISALLLLMLMSALAVAVLYSVNTEQRLQKTDTGNNLAYYGAEAGMEKIMVDLDSLYARNAAPTWCDITGLQTLYPTAAEIGVSYSQYRITILPDPPGPPTDCSPPDWRIQPISHGDSEGLIAQIIPLTLQVTADRPGGEQVSMVRQVEVALIPVFQFGVFSESDLSFFPGPAFDFKGRVQTNRNLFLASETSLTFHSYIRARGNIVRDRLANGEGTVAQGRTEPVYVPTASNGCSPNTDAASSCRELKVTPQNEGSSIGGPTPTYGGTGADNGNWATIASNYNGLLLASPDVKPLTMAFVQSGVNPIEILRRALPADTTALRDSRLYNQAQIRVLLSDDPAELPFGAADANNIRLANVAPYNNGVPVPGASGTYFAEGKTPAPPGESAATWPTPVVTPPLLPGGATWNLLDGYLRVEIRRTDGTFLPVTREWLELGFARRANSRGASATLVSGAGTEAGHPNAILLLQQQADRDGNGTVETAELVRDTPSPPGTNSRVRGDKTRTNWYPINFYDAREGERRELPQPNASTNCRVGGVMNVVEIDVRNLQRWLNGTIGANGRLTEQVSQNGYVLYFSDRRGMLPNPNAGNVKNGEYGFEDVINPAAASGASNNTLDTGEDVNANTLVDTWGQNNLGFGFGAGKSGDPNKTVDCMTVARKNWISGARHAVRLVNGTQGNLPVRWDPDHVGGGGFTLASENPAYVWGDYNANVANCSNCGDPKLWNFTGNHASSAVIADTVSLLSNGWTDLESFNSPTNIAGRGATTTYYRVAIASGKNINFPKPAWGGAPAIPNDFGTDGGVHNFLRYLEDWSPGGVNQTSYYMGSMVSLYYSQYATGVFKCCGTVYSPPNRNYAFDLDFQDLTKMPPGTPKFRDVVDIGFQQVF